MVKFRTRFVTILTFTVCKNMKWPLHVLLRCFATLCEVGKTRLLLPFIFIGCQRTTPFTCISSLTQVIHIFFGLPLLLHTSTLINIKLPHNCITPVCQRPCMPMIWASNRPDERKKSESMELLSCHLLKLKSG